MPRKKKLGADETPARNKRTKHFNDLQTKIKIIEQHEEGCSKSDISRKLGIPWSTVDSIVKNKERFKRAAKTVSGDVKLLFPRDDIFVEMEKQLVNWIREEEGRKHPLSGNLIRERAIGFFNSLKARDPGCKLEFRASKGWFYRFLKRTGLKCVVMDGEACIANAETAEKLVNEFNEVFNEYKPEQVFYFCEIGLLWKRMPESAFLAQETDDSVRDKMTVMLGSNAVGDFKIKPLIACSADNPKELEGLDEDSLPVIWRSSRKARITRGVFSDWFINAFQPSVEKYLRERNVEKKAILLLDKVFAYSTAKDSKSDFVRFMRVPRNTSPNHQPIDQRVPANFKRYYLKISLEQCFRSCTADKKAALASEVWKKYTIKDAILNVAAAWNETCENSLSLALRNLWSDRLVEDDKFIMEIVNRKIVELANKLGLHMSEDEIENLIKAKTDSVSEDNQADIDEDLEDSVDGSQADPSLSELEGADLQQLFMCVELIKKITDKDPVRERGYKCYKTIESACLPYKTRLKQIESKKQRVCELTSS